MIWIFALCTLLNVVLATIKSVMTIKGTKISAAFWNAMSFGLYSYIVILTATADLTTLEKVIITIVCNLIGVYGVKWVEEKMRKDKMWKIEMTIVDNGFTASAMHGALIEARISHHYFNAGKHAVFSCYCATKADTDRALEVGKVYGAKTFASETTLAP